ncbi:MAG: hypothetical protein V1725_04300 [archaeon]
MMRALPVIGLTALLLVGCCASNQQETPDYRNEYLSTTQQTVESIAELDGTIVDVQQGHISYCGSWDTRWDGSQISANHEIEYVLVQGNDNSRHVLIYPFTKAIWQGPATLKYRELPSGRIDANTFIDNYLDKSYFTDDNVVLEADGIIVGNGIIYN